MEKVQKQATTFFKEFQAFISKGNVVDLAVAVIVGAAFNNIISSLVKDIINPILGALIGKPDFTNLFWVMKMPADYTGPMIRCTDQGRRQRIGLRCFPYRRY